MNFKKSNLTFVLDIQNVINFTIIKKKKLGRVFLKTFSWMEADFFKFDD